MVALSPEDPSVRLREVGFQAQPLGRADSNTVTSVFNDQINIRARLPNHVATASSSLLA